MNTQRSPYPEQRSSASSPPTPAELFALLWAELTDVLGSAAAAILLRRSHASATARPPAKDMAAAAPLPAPRDPEQLSITRDGLEYRYRLPRRWAEQTPVAMEELRQLVEQLRPLLVALTGQVILRRLDVRPEFRAGGILFAPVAGSPEAGGYHE